MLLNEDCLEAMQKLIDDGVQVDSIVTDPPYHLTSIVDRFGKKGSSPAKHGTDGAFARASKGFMGKEWENRQLEKLKKLGTYTETSEARWSSTCIFCFS